MRSLHALAVALALAPVAARAQTAVKVYATDTVQSGCTLAAANATCTVAAAGKSTFRMLVTAVSSPTGMALVTESSVDGTNWTPHLFQDTETGSGLWTVPNASLAVGYTMTLGTGGGARWIRVRASARTSGSATVLVSGTDTMQTPLSVIARIRPVDPQALGSYQMTLTSGTIAAGITSGSTVVSMRWTSSSSVAAIRRVTAAVADITTAFTAGTGKLFLYRATSFSASDSGGTAATLTTPNGKKDTNFAATGVGDLRIASTGLLTVGTRTVGTMPLGAQIFAVSTTANAVMLATAAGDLLPALSNPNNYPVVLRANEGLIITTTMPATGTWNLWVTIEWDELAAFP